MNEYPKNYPCRGFHMCHGCGSMAPHHIQKSVSDNGWAFDINSFGSYGGFTDPIGEQPEWVRLCHDCVLKFLNTFPLIGLLVKAGNHSQFGPNEKPCCKYAWKTETISNTSLTYLASENGESWEIV